MSDHAREETTSRLTSGKGDPALIAFVRAERSDAVSAGVTETLPLWDAMLSVLEGTPHEDDSTRIGQTDVVPAPQHAAENQKD